MGVLLNKKEAGFINRCYTQVVMMFYTGLFTVGVFRKGKSHNLLGGLSATLKAII